MNRSKRSGDINAIQDQEQNPLASFAWQGRPRHTACRFQRDDGDGHRHFQLIFKKVVRRRISICSIRRQFRVRVLPHRLLQRNCVVWISIHLAHLWLWRTARRAQHRHKKELRKQQREWRIAKDIRVCDFRGSLNGTSLGCAFASFQRERRSRAP